MQRDDVADDIFLESCIKGLLSCTRPQQLPVAATAALHVALMEGGEGAGRNSKTNG